MLAQQHSSRLFHTTAARHQGSSHSRLTFSCHYRTVMHSHSSTPHRGRWHLRGSWRHTWYLRSSRCPALNSIPAENSGRGTGNGFSSGSSNTENDSDADVGVDVTSVPPAILTAAGAVAGRDSRGGASAVPVLEVVQKSAIGSSNRDARVLQYSTTAGAGRCGEVGSLPSAHLTVS